MGVLTLRPNGTANAVGFAAQGAASIHAATSDDSDASSARLASFTTSSGSPAQIGTLGLDLTTSALPALAQVKWFVVRARAAIGAGQRWMDLGLLLPGMSSARLVRVQPSGSPGEVSTHPLSPVVLGVPGSQASVDGAQVWAAAQPSYEPPGSYGQLAQLDVYEAYLDVYYNEAPVAGVSAPTGTVTATARPAVQFAYSDPDLDAMDRYRVKVFSAAQYGAPGFDPEASEAVWDSGEVFLIASSGSTVSATPPAPLLNGSYRAYAKAADAGSYGRWSAWDFEAFTVDLDPPAVPVVAAAAEPANGRVALTVQGRANILTTNQSSVETDTTGWSSISHTVSRDTAQALHGAASLKVVSAAGGTVNVTSPAGASGFAAAPATQYTLIGFVRAGAAPTAQLARLQLQWYDAAGASIRTDGTLTAAPSNTAWTAPAALTTVSPSNAAFGRVILNLQNAVGAGESYWWDKLSVAPGSSTDWSRGGLAAAQRVVVERSDDGGATWAACTRLADASGALVAYPLDLPDDSQLAVVYDHSAPARTPLLYRARATAVDPVAGGELVSADSASSAAELVNTGWWLKDPLDPSRDMAVKVVGQPRFSRREPQTVDDVLDDGSDPEGALPVVSSDGVKGWSGAVRVRTSSKAEWDALVLLTGSSRTLLLQTVWGGNWFVRLGEQQDFDPRRAADPSGAYPVRHLFEVDLSFTQVRAP